MPSVSLRKGLYDEIVRMVGGEKVNEFVNEAVAKELRRIKERGGHV